MSFDGLTRMEGTIMDVVWARTDIDLTGYRKVMFEGLGVEYREVSGPYSGRAGVSGTRTRSNNQTEFQLDAETRALFEEEISGAFLDAMARSDVFEIVEEAGPEVLLIRAGLLAVDGRAASQSFQMQQSTRATNRAEVRRLGRRWGDMLREGLDTLLTDGLKK